MSGIQHLSASDLVRATHVTAAGVLTERGWTTGSYGTEKGQVCAAGALNVVCTGSPRGAGGHRLNELSTPAYFTTHAAKRAFLRHVGISCSCECCCPMPAREVAGADHRYRVATDHYDTSIGRWNDEVCTSAADAVAALLSVPDALIAEAVRAEFDPEWFELALPSLTPVPVGDLPPRRVMALV